MGRRRERAYLSRVNLLAAEGIFVGTHDGGAYPLSKMKLCREGTSDVVRSFAMVVTSGMGGCVCSPGIADYDFFRTSAAA